MPDLLLDTDVFVDHLRGVRKLRTGREHVLYSVITRCELFAGRETDEEVVQRVLAPFEEIPVIRSIAEHAGRLRRTAPLRTPDALIAATAMEHGSPLRTPDALIAATAMEHGLVLVTRNTRDFHPVRGLKVRQPQ